MGIVPEENEIEELFEAVTGDTTLDDSSVQVVE